MKHRLKFLTAGIVFISMQAPAQQKTITLSEAINLGLQNSKQLKINQAEIEQAMAQLQQAEDKRLPDASLTGAYSRLLTGNFDLQSKSSSGGTAQAPPKVHDAVYGILNASLPVYAGGRISYGIESAKYLAQAARLDAEGNKDEVIQNTIEAFANLFKANSAVRLVKENLAQSQERGRELANLEKNGLLARNDLLKAQLQTSNVELSLVDAENNLQLATINMDLMLGLPTSTALVIDTNGIEKKEDERTLDEFVKAAANNRKDLAALDLRRKAAETGVKEVRGEKLPAISITGGYMAADIPKFITVTNVFNLGLGVSYNIGSLWKNKAKEKEAQAKLSQLTATEALLNDNLEMQVSKSYLALLSGRKKIQVYAKAVEQANENYRIVKNKFDNNLATTSDLLDADVAKLQANLSYTLARADAFVAYNKLLQTTGLLALEIKK